MTRLGFVGVGKHAQKMAAAFRECGAEVVAFDRMNHPESGTQGWGYWLPWRDMITNDDVDALIICAPPDVTTEVALACAKAGKRCVATKPLMWTTHVHADHCPFPGAPGYCARCHNTIGPGPAHCEAGGWEQRSIYVDLWRLYSPAWQDLKAELRGEKIESVKVEFTGKGPFRDFSGALDYGPHALAFLLDLLGAEWAPMWRCESLTPLMKQRYGMSERANIWTLTGKASGSEFEVRFGNGASEPRSRLEIMTNAGRFTWDESLDPRMLGTQFLYVAGSNTPIMACNRSLALWSFARSFLAGEPSDTLRLSCEAMRVLMPLAEQSARPEP